MQNARIFPSAQSRPSLAIAADARRVVDCRLLHREKVRCFGIQVIRKQRHADKQIRKRLRRSAKNPVQNHRQFRFSRLNTPEFSHVWLLLYWPIFGLGFSYVERFYPVAHYIEMHCALDDLIPFNEWFLIPYLFWFVYLIGAVAYTFFFDVPGFRRMMRFVMITYSVTLIIYFLFPTCQMLRPEVFPRDNALTRFIAGFYVFDTNTNVCPSLHVIGSMAAFFAFWYAPIFSKRGWRIASTVAAFFISISTVFMKQHSILDVAAAIPLCAIGYYFAYVRTPKKSRSAVPDVTR